jgi:hypothetical protein
MGNIGMTFLKISKKNMKRVIFYLLFLPISLFGQNKTVIDSVMNFGLGDTTMRKVYFVAEEMPKLLNEKPIASYLMSQSLTIDSCCAFRAYIGFIVEPDSTISNKMVYVHAVNCKEQGLVYNGQEISLMESRIFEILSNMPAIIPGKIDNKNVAVKMSFPVHVDCFMR